MWEIRHKSKPPKSSAPGSQARPERQRPVGLRRVVYWIGRGLEGLGLLLIWWVLLLFTGAADMWTLLYWSFLSVIVFYVGWTCTVWAKKST